MKVTKNLENSSTNEGWSIQVYSGDRRLLCSLGSGHLWMFVAGFVAGFLIAAGSFQTERSPTTPLQSVDPERPAAPLEVD
jgi:hypothetical protein